MISLWGELFDALIAAGVATPEQKQPFLDACQQNIDRAEERQRESRRRYQEYLDSRPLWKRVFSFD